MTAREVLDGIRGRLTGPRRSWEVKEEDRDKPSVWHDSEVAFPIGQCPECGVEAEYEPEDAEFIAAAPTDVARLVAAVEGVLGVHKPEQIAVHEGFGAEVWCPECRAYYPCPTVAAIEAALKEDPQ